MVSSDSDVNPDDVRDVAVPPLEDDMESEFLDENRSFQTEKFARYAQKESGTPGAIGVALGLISDVESDLNLLAEQEPEQDIDYLIDYLGWVSNILTYTADQYITDYDSPLYETEDSDEDREEDTEPDEEVQWSREKFAQVTIDDVNGKGNILARPDHLSQDHIHLSHGQKGEEVIVFLGTSTSLYSNHMQHLVVPFSTVEEAQKSYSKDTALQIQKGDLVKIPGPVIKDGSKIAISGFNIGHIQIDGEVPKRYELTVKIEEIEGETARGTIEGKTKLRQHRRKKKRRKKSYSGSGKQRYAGQGNNSNPFKGRIGKRNDLLKDNPR